MREPLQQCSTFKKLLYKELGPLILLGTMENNCLISGKQQAEVCKEVGFLTVFSWVSWVVNSDTGLRLGMNANFPAEIIGERSLLKQGTVG